MDAARREGRYLPESYDLFEWASPPEKGGRRSATVELHCVWEAFAAALPISGSSPSAKEEAER